MSEDAHVPLAGEADATKSTPPPVYPQFMDMFYSCRQCGRQLTHSFIYGYFCEYCAGIED